MPLAIPAALATGAALPVTIGAVLSGGLFGDHSSPVSETTILSSTGAGTTPIEHFRTQLPYALLNGGIAFVGFLLAGLTAIVWIAVFAIVVQMLLLGVIRRSLTTLPG
jgi:Na+/H+ antiporter NhaC